MKHSEDSVQLLTVGNGTYSNDNRLTIAWRYPGNWTLQIAAVQLEDSGCYQCQVNTHPPISLFVNLHVQGVMRERFTFVAITCVCGKFYDVGTWPNDPTRQVHYMSDLLLPCAKGKLGKHPP